VPLWRGTLALLSGRWDEGERLSREALALGRRADDPNAPLFVGIQFAHRLYAQQRIAEIDRDRLVSEAGASAASAEWLINLALLDAATGATDDARRLIADLTRDGRHAFAMDANWHAASVLADAAARLGDREAAALAYDLIEPHAGLFPLVARAVGCLWSNEYFVGRVAGVLGRHDEAVARLRRAVDENDRAGAAPWATSALAGLGEALAAQGDREAARDALGRAARRAHALEMPVVLADAERLLATLG
jgi:tetratricopeptide (TPR) repeat protein